jgi:sugar/nucleoside kinase (ribokinase family)
MQSKRRTAMFDVCVIGHMCVDLMVKPLERLPPKGKLVLVDKLHVSAGGCGLNSAVYLAVMGVKTAILGKTGDDPLGDVILKTYERAGVDITGLKRDSVTGTSGTLVAIDPKGERTLMHYLGTNGTFCFEDVDVSFFERSRILFIGGTFIMPRFDGEDAAKVLALAKEKNLLCALDTAWDASAMWMRKIEVCLQFLDWFMPSYEEAVELSGERDIARMANVFFAKGVGNVVIKLGAEGCYVAEHAKEGYTLPALRNVLVKDTSGAGDAFCSGFLAGLAKGWEIRKCAELGNAVGALCVTEIGTTTAARRFDEVLDFAKSHL